MRRHLYNPDFKFTVEPENFNKYMEREILQYCLGAIMYMPGTEGFAPRIIFESMPGLTTIVLCFEDACPAGQMEVTETDIHRPLDTVVDAVDAGALSPEKMPLVSVRIRSLAQFKHFGGALTKRQVRFLYGINFPKSNAENEYEYHAYLEDLSERFGEILHSIPAAEDPEVAYKESYMQGLVGTKKILDKYRNLALQARVDRADFSSVLGVCCGVDYSTYGAMTVRECPAGIVNVRGRENDYVISGPTWEYFRAPKATMLGELPHHGLEDYPMRQLSIVNDEVDGLFREVILDKTDGFVDCTVIHPIHIKFVNTLMAVTKEEYDGACMILGHTQGGAVEGSGANKIDEAKPHTNWARKMCNRARAFGVIENEGAYIKLLTVNES